MKKLALALFLMFGFSVSSAFAQYGQCPEGHCGAKSATVKRACDALKIPVVFVEYGADFCWCPCSCVAGQTLIYVPGNAQKRMDTFAIGDKVLALKGGSWIESTVTYSGAGGPPPEKPYPYAVFLQMANGAALITTADHVFILADKSLKRADRLTPDDVLLDTNLKPVRISSLAVGSYLGSLANITTDAPTPEGEGVGSIEGHIIATNGILSGDFYAQNWLVPQTQKNLPQLGTAAYTKVFSRKDALKLENNKLLKDGKIDFGEGRVFTPYKMSAIPDKAASFLPPEYEQPAEGVLSPLDYTVPYEMAEYIVYNYKRYYPEIIFTINWTDDRVNAYAWIEGGRRRVELLGGLIRHRAVKAEGVGLVLAHEIGHHYGGPPRYPAPSDWASCEGQSDYWGALVAERAVWWGPESVRQIKEGGFQLYNLFAFGLRVGNLFSLERGKAVAGCSHPPASCRLETYNAAARLDPKPACAGPEFK